MFVHHIATIALVGACAARAPAPAHARAHPLTDARARAAGSYYDGYVRIGVLVLVVHDASDVLIDALKINNLLKLQELGSLFAVEISFVLTLAIWVVFRLGVFPLVILKSAIFDTACVLSPDPSACEPWAFFRLPSTEGKLWHWHTFVALLGTLLVLHVWWGYLLVRIAVRLITAPIRQVSRDEYEGASTDGDVSD